MARITIEDCLDSTGDQSISNRFELVALAAQRAKEINSGEQITVDRDNDKNAVIALREIALKHLNIAVLKKKLISGLRQRNNVDFAEVENVHAECEDINDEFASYADTEFEIPEESILDLDSEDIDIDE